MRTRRALTLMFIIVLTATLMLPALPGAAPLAGSAVAQEQSPRPIELQDIMEWNRISAATLSDDGAWLAYRVAPAEGNGEAVIRSTRDETGYRFPIGAASGGGFGGGGGISISEDSRWVAFTIYPEFTRGGGRGDGDGPPRNKLGLLDLSSGEMTEFDEVRSFAFSGDNAAWLAMAKYPAGGNGGAGGGGAAGARGGRGGAGGGGGNGDNERARGADLILLQLATATQMNIGNVAEFEFDESGDHLAWVIDTASKAGNGVQIRMMDTGVVVPLESSDASYRSLNWTEAGDGLTVLKGVDDEDYEDPLYSVIGFTDMRTASPTKIVYDPAEDDAFPAGMNIASSRTPSFSEDLGMLVFGIVEAEMTEEAKQRMERGDDQEAEAEGEDQGGRRGAGGERNEDEPEKPELVIWHWKDDRLQSQQQVEENRDRNFSYLSVYHVADGRFVRLADDDVPNVALAPGEAYATGTDMGRYELMGNLNGQRFMDVYVVDLATGDRTMALERSRWYNGASPEGSHLLYYEDGDYYTYEVATGTRYNITEDVDTSFINAEDDHNIVDPPIRPIGWTAGGTHVLLYDNWDIWKVAAHGDKGVNLTVNGKDEQIRYGRRFRLDPDEEGIDLSQDQYLAPYGEWTKKSGIGRIAAGSTGVDMLMWDDVAYGTLMKAEDADVFAYTMADQDSYPDYYVTDLTFSTGDRITDANPQQTEFTWSAGARLIDYKCDKGDKLQAALFLPANYEPGKKYPTIVYIYEKPVAGPQPIHAAVSQRLQQVGVHVQRLRRAHARHHLQGQRSRHVGGLVRAAGPRRGHRHRRRRPRPRRSARPLLGRLPDLVPGDPDRQVRRRRGRSAADQHDQHVQLHLLEHRAAATRRSSRSSQGRFNGDYLETTDAYIRNSPVFFADKVKTPLIILHNDKDGAVDWNQGIEYYNTLRRLGKDVVMLQYVGENHGLREPANQKDYTVRMREFFDHHLKGEPAPQWLLEGVPHLKMEEHLDERSELVKPRDSGGGEARQGGGGGRGGGGSGGEGSAR